MRSLFLLLATSCAYLFLRGWPEGVPPLMRTCLAVLLLVLGLGLWTKKPRHRHPRARSLRRPGVSDYLAVGVGVLAIECLFVFLLTVAPPKAEELAMSLDVYAHPGSNRSEGASGPGEGAGAANNSGNWLWDQHGRRRLSKRSSAVPSNKPEVFLRPHNPESAHALSQTRPYLRAFALERYEDASWRTGIFAPDAKAGENDGWRTAMEGHIQFPQPSQRPGKPISVQVFHPRHPSGQDVFLALQGATATDLPTLRAMAPGIHRLPPPESTSGYDYLTTSKPVYFDQLITGSRMPVIIPASEADPSLLQLPADPKLRDSILQIAVKTQGTLDDRLIALRKFLASNCTYSLKVENPNDLDPLENFLFHERRGHCEYFASAGALLCRALGIPSRVAYGWAGGRHYEASNLYLFRAREAHAWTEILIKDVGWVIFDLTPPGAREAATSSKAPLGETLPFDDPNAPFEDHEDEETSLLEPWTLEILGSGLGLAALTLLLLRWRARPETAPSPGGSTLLPEPPNYLLRFRRACAKHGHPMPTGRTLLQHLLLLEDGDQGPEFAEELLEYHYALTYGNAAQDRKRERRLAKAIKGWR